MRPLIDWLMKAFGSALLMWVIYGVLAGGAR